MSGANPSLTALDSLCIWFTVAMGNQGVAGHAAHVANRILPDLPARRPILLYACFASKDLLYSLGSTVQMPFHHACHLTWVSLD